MTEPVIVQVVRRHGGIGVIHTHRACHTDRRTGLRVWGWVNTITCRDGYRRELTDRDERILADWLPEELMADEHVIDD